ncbi:zinc finger CCCH-type with G patch domain-containing protein [Folsomia candida]|uniref:zinc finger CCCH-type with G patch domain-containing protein n=1 Tax=Folsomia candida TaxID=158441 RepID=UPI000B906A38|nr:zinc finger CCCH-type with G patch domain-containing protein [Folsomia candida]
MDQDIESLKSQLSQMQSLLPLVTGEEKVEIQNVISQLEELISTVSASTSRPNEISIPDDDEYAMFSAEIASIEQEFSNLNNGTENSTATTSSKISINDIGTEHDVKDVQEQGSTIQEELSALEGMRCIAPHEEQWGQIGYYPAMISEVINCDKSDLDGSTDEFNCVSEIKVRVIFLHPVVKSQLMCPYLKDNCCKFSEFECRYSHGEIVQFSKLRDYSEPDYTKVVPSARVLAKYHDGLWYNATVLRLTKDGNCEVQFDKDDTSSKIGVDETVPLNTSEIESSDEEEYEDDVCTLYEDVATQNLECDLLKITSADVLGDWEKHTTGFGSRLMMKMGYVMGSGLGKESEGRVLPVDAIMVPLGMSLDQFMNLKENKKIGKERFSVEKKLKQAHKHHAHKEKQLSERNKKITSVFDFLNNKLHKKKTVTSISSSLGNVQKKNCLSLKQDMLSVGEEMRKVNKDITKMHQSLKRIEGRDAATENLMKSKLGELEIRRNELVRIENSIIKEQNNRSDKKKLTEF